MREKLDTYEESGFKTSNAAVKRKKKTVENDPY